MKMTLLLLLVYPFHAQACFSMKKQPNFRGLEDKTLCLAQDGMTYDYSFSKNLILRTQKLSSRMVLVNARFTELSLRDSKLQLDLRDFSGKGKWEDTIIIDSDLRFADFRGLSLLKVRFEKSRFHYANLSGVDLREVEFLDCDLEGAIIDHRTQLPFSLQEALEKGMVIK